LPYFTNLIRIVRAEGPKEAQKATNERQSAKMSWIVLRRNSARQDFPLELWVANATKMSASHWIAARLTMIVNRKRKCAQRKVLASAVPKY